jgi:hypothetical protein
MRKIFYNPDTLEIKAMTDGDTPLELPYVETDVDYHATDNLSIIDVEGTPTLNIEVGALDNPVNDYDPESEPLCFIPMNQAEEDMILIEFPTRIDTETAEEIYADFKSRRV